MGRKSAALLLALGGSVILSAQTPAQPNCSASIRVTIALVLLPSMTATRGRLPSAVQRKGGSLRIAALAIGPKAMIIRGFA